MSPPGPSAEGTVIIGQSLEGIEETHISGHEPKMFPGVVSRSRANVRALVDKEKEKERAGQYTEYNEEAIED
jgi:hypothetical protein